ncbi:MAG: hypothetical protein QOH97_4389 [Actinoplanes sp.]|jgi:uncharacterized RDD family membrane protein YckC|nr:hypothetical protein [Actinoplanes sp.]
MRPPPPVSPAGAPLADFGSRLLAVLIDGAILTGVGMVVIIPVFYFVLTWMTRSMHSINSPSGTRPDPYAVISGVLLPLILLELGFVVFMLILYYVYYVEMLYNSGQTIGKKALKIRVVPLDPAATLTRGMAAKRYAIEFVVGTFVPFFRYLDGLWQLWDKPYLQTLHDKVAKTVVIKVSP